MLYPIHTNFGFGLPCVLRGRWRDRVATEGVPANLTVKRMASVPVSWLDSGSGVGTIEMKVCGTNARRGSRWI